MNLITPTEMHVDDVDSGVPLLTFDASSMGGPGPITYALSRDAVRGLVDALSGVAPVAPGEVRLTVKADVGALRDGSWVKLSLETPMSTPDVGRIPLAQQAWLEDMAALGAQIAHPDDGWVDREANTIMFAYPSMRKVRPAPGVLVALGAPEKWRLVMLTREVREPLGTPKWAFVESPPAAESSAPTPVAPTGQPQPVWRVLDGEGAWWWFWPETDCFGAKLEQPCRGCGGTAPPTLDHVADERASLRRIRDMLAPMLGLGVDEEPAEVMVDRATRIPRLAVLLGCPVEVLARGWMVQRPWSRGDGTWMPGAILAGHECREWGTSLDVPDGTVGEPDRGLDVALSLLEAS